MQCISINSLTFPLLYSDMGQSEHGEEPLLVLQLWRSVHLLRSEACAELRRRGSAFRLRGRWRGAALPEHPSPLPSLLLHQLIPPAHRSQAKHSQELQFLFREAREIISLQFLVMSACLNFHHRKHRKGMCWQLFYLCGVIQFEWGLFCYSSEVSSHLFLITFILVDLRLVVLAY